MIYLDMSYTLYTCPNMTCMYIQVSDIAPIMFVYLRLPFTPSTYIRLGKKRYEAFLAKFWGL